MLCSTGWFNDWANLACPNRALSNREVHLEKGKGRGYLETIESLKRKLQKDDQAHRGDLMRVMHANVSLIKEINELRREMTRP